MRRVTVALALLLAAPAAAQAQSATPVVGGGSFNTAPLLTPGSYADTVAAGETVYWKVALAKGQVLSARATVDTSEIETDFRKGDYLKGLDHLNYRIDLFTPLREPLSDELEWEDATTTLEGDAGAGAKTGEAVAPRTLGFEQILGTDYRVGKFPAPGTWYISLSAADSDIYPAEIPAELPVELDIVVDGTAEPSSANFAARLPGPTATPGSTAVSSTDQIFTGDAGAGDPTLTIALVGGLALLGGLGLGALASRLLVRP